MVNLQSKRIFKQGTHPHLHQAYASLLSYHRQRLVDLGYLVQQSYPLLTSPDCEQQLALLKRLRSISDGNPYSAGVADLADMPELVVWARPDVMSKLDRLIREHILEPDGPAEANKPSEATP